MKRKTVLMFLAMILLAVSIAGCGSSASSTTSTAAETQAAVQTPETKAEKETTAVQVSETTSIPVEPLDLTGLWIQDKHAEDTYMVADVREDGKIGVFFYVENDTPWTYWIGTYDAPDTDSKKYSWTSTSTYAGNGLLASSDSSKKFAFEDEFLKFPITIQGQTGEIYLVRGDWDVSKIPESVYAEKVSEEAKESALSGEFLEVTDSGWYMHNEWLKYYVKLKNTSEDTAIEFPSYRITARDKDGIVLGSDEQVLSIIYPGQEFVFGSQAFSVDEMPETVEFEPLPPSDYNLKNTSTMQEYKPLTIINDKIRSEKYVGEISNPNDYDIDNVRVMIIGWDSEGNLVEIEADYLDKLSANVTIPFAMSIRPEKEIAKYESFATQW